MLLFPHTNTVATSVTPTIRPYHNDNCTSSFAVSQCFL